jgi:hypothetical protein
MGTRVGSSKLEARQAYLEKAEGEPPKLHKPIRSPLSPRYQRGKLLPGHSVLLSRVQPDMLALPHLSYRFLPCHLLHVPGVAMVLHHKVCTPIPASCIASILTSQQLPVSPGDASHYQPREIRIRNSMDDHHVLGPVPSLPGPHCHDWALWTRETSEQVLELESHSSYMSRT